MSRVILQNIIDDFSPEKFVRFFREKNRAFAPRNEWLAHYDDSNFRNGQKIGELLFPNRDEQLIICDFEAVQPLSERSGKKSQYEKAKKILKEIQSDAGIFIFYDKENNFRFSLIYANYLGTRRDWSNFRRFTYFVSSEFTNKTFLQRIGDGDFSSLEKIKEAFSVEKVTKSFYTDIANWYFWAVRNSKFPKDAESEDNGRNIAIIRMITRLIFIWFMREKGLIRKDLFDYRNISELLKDLSPKKTTYYKAILQNLFFATLNTKIKNRKFRFKITGWKNSSYMDPQVYRYEDYFKNQGDMLEIFKDIPFLNGGLFDCLDIPSSKNNNQREIRVDGFSDKEKGLNVPNFLFFSGEKDVDLNKEYGTKNKKHKVRGLIDTLSSYNFTIDENEPNDQEVALDPELLGKVFENLLASFNPETASTARKATGSYYTPREIVDYMVTQSLKEYFKTHLKNIDGLDEKLNRIFSPATEENPFSAPITKKIVKLIDDLRIVDPAVGSGAFPMGILNKLVFILSKLDPDNKLWKEAQMNAVEASVTDPVLKKDLKDHIAKRFAEKNLDYGRKLYLIQKCIYGVDIQQIAVEIAKLRFFISLLVDEKIDKNKENWGIEALPNLDFKIMQGNSLISEFMGINFDADEKENSGKFVFKDEVSDLIGLFQRKKNEFQDEPEKRKKDKLKQEIEDLIINIFKVKLKNQRADYFRKLKTIEETCSILPNKKQREENAAKAKQSVYKKEGFNLETVEKQLHEFTSGQKVKPFFAWKLYFAEVFQGENPGFDIVIANPPYGILNKKQNKAESIVVSDEELAFFKNSKYYEPASGGMINVFRLFILRSIYLLAKDGIFSEIFPLAFTGDLSISGLRKYILDHNEILFIEAFPERDNSNKRVFEAVKMSVCILNLKKAKTDSPFFIRINSDKFIDENAEKNYLTQEIISEINPKHYTLPLTSSKETNLLSKVFSNSIRFNQIGKCNTGEVDMTFCKNSFTDNPKAARLLKGAIIDRYQLRTKMSQGEIVFIDEKILFEIKKNLSSDFKNKERIVLQGITGINESSRLKMMIIKDAYCANSLNYLTLKRDLDLKYLLGIFNSKLLNFIFSKFSTNSNVNGYEVDSLPIVINNAFVNPINEIVDKILAITKSSDYLENPAKKEEVKEYEKQIDRMVYKLYDLTDEEIKVVENN